MTAYADKMNNSPLSSTDNRDTCYYERLSLLARHVIGALNNKTAHHIQEKRHYQVFIGICYLKLAQFFTTDVLDTKSNIQNIKLSMMNSLQVHSLKSILIGTSRRI